MFPLPLVKMVMVLDLVNLSCGSAHFTGVKIYGNISVDL